MGEDVLEIRTSDGDDLLITAFWGGREHGRCYQFTVHGPTGLSESRERKFAYASLTESQAVGLIEALGGYISRTTAVRVRWRLAGSVTAMIGRAMPTFAAAYSGWSSTEPC